MSHDMESCDQGGEDQDKACLMDRLQWRRASQDFEAMDRIQDRWPYYQEGQTCLHIGHLVPLERSNIAMLLGSSGVVRSSENPLKMIVKC